MAVDIFEKNWNFLWVGELNNYVLWILNFAALSFRNLQYTGPLLHHGLILHDFGYNTVKSWTLNYFQNLSVRFSRHKKFIYFCSYHCILTKKFSWKCQTWQAFRRLTFAKIHVFMGIGCQPNQVWYNRYICDKTWDREFNL